MFWTGDSLVAACCNCYGLIEFFFVYSQGFTELFSVKNVYFLISFIHWFGYCAAERVCADAQSSNSKGEDFNHNSLSATLPNI